jgi:hypothetical protein
MIRLYLRRYGSTPMGTFGVLTLEEDDPSGHPKVIYTAFTVELPWKGNVPYESCIPAGHYAFVPRYYNRGEYDSYTVCDVKGRSHILMHIANSISDLLGCIGVGEELGFVFGKWAVTNSKHTFKRIMGLMRGREATIYITWTHHPEAL